MVLKTKKMVFFFRGAFSTGRAKPSPHRSLSPLSAACTKFSSAKLFTIILKITLFCLIKTGTRSKRGCHLPA